MFQVQNTLFYPETFIPIWFFIVHAWVYQSSWDWCERPELGFILLTIAKSPYGLDWNYTLCRNLSYIGFEGYFLMQAEGSDLIEFPIMLFSYAG